MERNANSLLQINCLKKNNDKKLFSLAFLTHKSLPYQYKNHIPVLKQFYDCQLYA